MLRVASACPSQIAPARLDRGRERAVVDERALDGRQAADPLQRLAPHQHAAARRGRGPRASARSTQRERVEHREEEHEGRDQRPLGPGLAVESRTICETRSSPPRLRPRHQPGEARRLVRDVGVGEQDVTRLGHRGLGVPHALRHRPDLAGPARRRRLGAHDLQPLRRAPRRRERHLGRAVAAAVVDQHNPERPGIFLASSARTVSPTTSASSRAGTTATTGGARPQRRRGVEPHAPEQAARQQQVGPGQRRRGGRRRSSQHGRWRGTRRPRPGPPRAAGRCA